MIYLYLRKSPDVRATGAEESSMRILLVALVALLLSATSTVSTEQPRGERVTRDLKQDPLDLRPAVVNNRPIMVRYPVPVLGRNYAAVLVSGDTETIAYLDVVRWEEIPMDGDCGPPCESDFEAISSLDPEESFDLGYATPSE